MKIEKEVYQFWLDKIAEEIVEREKKLKRGIKIFRTESGLGASGFPHIGSFGDVVRNYSVSLALKDLGLKSELIAYSDDRDGLRKVPLTLPDWLEKYIGVPVTDIPDPFGKCHNSFGEHMSSLLLDALEKAGIEYKNHSGNEDYKKGIFNKEIETILLNAGKAGKIVKDMLGQEKFAESLPYFPVCEKCGKIYTTRSYELLPKEHKVLYVCDQEFTGKNVNNGKIIPIKGCGHKGEASYFNGTGKMSWKVEFAMRWAELEIVFEAHGKDIVDSVKVNDEIDRQILNFEPPLHVVYEMFLDKGGKKIAKSHGNVFTPQVWFNYGNTQSLILLMLKRFEGTRELDVTDIPKYMDELDKLEKTYFGLEKVKNEKDLINLKRLFEFVYFLKQPKKSSVHVPYDVIIEVAKILPKKDQLEFAIGKLKESGHVKKLTENNKEKIRNHLSFAINWIKDFERPEFTEVTISETEKEAVKELIKKIEEETDGEKLQTVIFEIAKRHKIKPIKFFKIIYQILLKSDRGPRLGPYVIDRGKSEVIKILRSFIE
jgi:lysyl-tRNA synthetase class 1